MAESKFWMCWAEKRCPPVKKHETYAEALAEAKRLSEKLMANVYVLEARDVLRPSIVVDRKALERIIDE